MKFSKLFVGVTYLFFVALLIGLGFETQIVKIASSNTVEAYKYLGEERKDYNVFSYKDLYDDLNSDTDQELNIILMDDIDLSNNNDFENLGSINNNTARNITIDGNGHSISNKPSDMFFIPVIAELNGYDGIDKGQENFNLTVKNLTLSGVGSFIGKVNITNNLSQEQVINSLNPSSEDYGIHFQNITINDNNLNGKNLNYIYEENVYSGDLEEMSFSFLVDSFVVNYYDDLIEEQEKETISSFVDYNNVHIENNNIDNNNIFISNADSSSKFGIGVSFLGNVFINFNDLEDSNTYLKYNYIFIENNNFSFNSFTINGNPISYHENFSSLSNLCIRTTAEKSSNNIYLYLTNIFIMNNNIASNLSKNNFNYYDLISEHSTINSQETLKVTLSIIDARNIFSFNNTSYAKNSDNTIIPLVPGEAYVSNIYYSIQDSTSINIIDPSSMFFYGNLFDDEENLNLANEEQRNISDVHYGKYLTIDSKDYNSLMYILTKNYGANNLIVENKLISNEKNKIINVVDSIDTNEGDKIDLNSLSFLYKNKEVVGFDLKFRFYTQTSSKNIDTTDYMYLSNLQIIDSSENLLASSNDTSIVNDYGLYEASFKLQKSIQPNVLNIYEFLQENTLYLRFQYSNGSVSKTIPLEKQNLLFSIANPFFKNNEIVSKKDINPWMISTSILIIIIVIFLIIMMILFIWFRKKVNSSNPNKKISKEKGSKKINSDSKTEEEIKKLINEDSQFQENLENQPFLVFNEEEDQDYIFDDYQFEENYDDFNEY